MKMTRRLVFWVVAGVMMLTLFTQIVCAQPPAEKKDEKKAEEVKKAPAEGEKKAPPARESEQPGVRRAEPGAMQERQMSRMKETLGCTDEEWKTIEPQAKALIDARSKSMMGGFRGRRDSGATPAGPSEMEELRKAVDSEKSTPDEIKQKLEAYRAMRKKNEDEVKKAQEGLKKVVNPKQEARLVLMGYLE